MKRMHVARWPWPLKRRVVQAKPRVAWWLRVWRWLFPVFTGPYEPDKSIVLSAGQVRMRAHRCNRYLTMNMVRMLAGRYWTRDKLTTLVKAFGYLPGQMPTQKGAEMREHALAKIVRRVAVLT